MIILQLSDFKGGKYDLPDSVGVYVKNDLQETIDKYEKQYIYQLLGVEQGNLFIAWLAANQSPPNAFYSKILNPFATDGTYYSWYWSCYRHIIESQGMKEYLKAAIFYEYTKVGLITSQAGVTQPLSETAIQQSPASTMRFSENKFNDVLDTIEAIQWYCMSEETAFPAFKGQRLTVKASNIF